MNNIPTSVKRKMALDPFYKTCCLTGERGSYGDPIQWHHNLIYAHKQVQEAFAILPIKKSLHELVSNSMVKDRLDWVMLNRASEAEIRKYSKVVDLSRRREYLNSVYGVWSPESYATELV